VIVDDQASPGVGFAVGTNVEYTQAHGYEPNVYLRNVFADGNPERTDWLNPEKNDKGGNNNDVHQREEYKKDHAQPAQKNDEEKDLDSSIPRSRRKSSPAIAVGLIINRREDRLVVKGWIATREDATEHMVGVHKPRNCSVKVSISRVDKCSQIFESWANVAVKKLTH
jgi:hypothetical protein